MIPVKQVEQPSEFDALVRDKGIRWLDENPERKKRPPSYWSACRHHLAMGSDFMCAYTAMQDLHGTIDHFVSIDEDRRQAYDWSNYRYSAGWVNSYKNARKKSSDLLDPFDVGPDWFEIRLGTFQLVITGKVPPEKRALAEAALEDYPIGQHPRIRDLRRWLYRQYRDGKKKLDEIRSLAPLLASAIEKEEEAGRSPISIQTGS